MLRNVFATARSRPTWLVPFCIVIAVFVVQLLTLNVYGVTWDEPLHRNWAELFLRFWQTGDSAYLQSMPGNGMYYGPIYFVLNYLVSIMAMGKLGLSLTASSHLLGVSVTSASCGLMYAYVRSVFGGRVAWYALFFLLTYPQLGAHAQYNPKDIPVLAAAIALFAGVSMLLRYRSMKWAVVSGLALGLGIAAKLSAITLIPSLVVIAACSAWIDMRTGDVHWFRKHVSFAAVIAAVAALVMVLAWPTLWRQPSLLYGALQFFLTEPFWPGKVLYFGTEYSGGSLPWHYMLVQFYLATPLLTLGCLLAGTAVAIRSRARKEFLVVLCWLWIPLLLTLKPGMPRYDGIRQLLFCIPALCLLAGIGFDAFTRLAMSRMRHIAIWFLVFALFSWNAIEVFRVFPFGGSYVSESARLVLQRNIHDTFELEYWGSSYLQANEWLSEHVQPGDEVCVPIAEYLMTWYAWPQGVTFGCSPNSAYVVFFTRYSKKYREKFTALTPAFAVERFNTPLLQIYDLD